MGGNCKRLNCTTLRVEVYDSTFLKIHINDSGFDYKFLIISQFTDIYHIMLIADTKRL